MEKEKIIDQKASALIRARWINLNNAIQKFSATPSGHLRRKKNLSSRIAFLIQYLRVPENHKLFRRYQDEVLRLN